MSQSHFSLSWERHAKSISEGLSLLQQKGDMVDMTLAADGHLVKVHKLIMALCSPYLKALISSAQGSHPVIFLNKISYQTLCDILEYVYTGEVVVSINHIKDLVQAAKELHIKGLEDMNLGAKYLMQTHATPDAESKQEFDSHVFYEGEPNDNEMNNTLDDQDETSDRVMMESLDETIQNDDDNDGVDEENKRNDNEQDKNHEQMKSNIMSNPGLIQYTVSNQGSLQIILNRFIYYLKHTTLNKSRTWRCTDYISRIKCPAYVVTRNNVVIKRTAIHTHPFHDKRIMKKVRDGAIFMAIQEAESEGKAKKCARADKGKETNCENNYSE